MALALPVSPSAERNKQPILGVLLGVLPREGRVLEIASGSGQHVVHFAAATPRLEWQPSELDPTNRAVVALRVERSGLANVRAPLAIDVHDEPWIAGADAAPSFDALVCINMIHIAPWSATDALFRGASANLRAAAPLALYGPFKEGGRHTADSNDAFDRRLRAENAAWGVRDLGEVEAAAAAHGFTRESVHRMPANNLSVVFRLY